MSDSIQHANDHIDLLNGKGGVSRRLFVQLAASTLLFTVSRGAHAASTGIVAVRVWPADDYTRVTLESTAPLVFKQFTVENPDRLVVDLEGVSFDEVLQTLSSKVLGDDPYIKSVRVGRNQPKVVRLVFDLKTKIKPEVFTLPPVSEYGHRLVVDLRPVIPNDPLMALLDQPKASDANAKAAEPATQVAEKPSASEPEAKPSNGKRPKGIVVAIDPGHGGEDPGAVGSRGTYEKHVTLTVSKRLKEKLENKGMKVILTRDSDFFVPLGERVSKARAVRADLFVSIHADAFVKPEARGSSVFMLSDKSSSSVFARWLAKTQNESDLIGGIKLGRPDPFLAHTILDLTTTATRGDSRKLGDAVLKEIAGINTLHSPRVEGAAFAVLKAPDIPSILVETAFISNPEEELKLRDEGYQGQLANAIATGIGKYLGKSAVLARNGA